MKKMSGKVISTSLAVAMMLTMPTPAAFAAENVADEFQAGDIVSDVADGGVTSGVEEFSDGEGETSVAVQQSTEDVPAVEDEANVQAATATIDFSKLVNWSNHSLSANSAITFDNDYHNPNVEVKNAGTADNCSSTVYYKMSYEDDTHWRFFGKWRGGSYDNDGNSEVRNKFLQAGTYDFCAIDNDTKTKYVTTSFTIRKANNSWYSLPSMLGKVYDGTAVAGPSNGTSKFNDGLYRTVKYYSQGLPLLNGAPTDAGNYYVEVIVPSTTNYNALSSGYIPFTISKASVSLSVEGDLNKFYDGQSASLTNENITVSDVGTGKIADQLSIGNGLRVQWYDKDKNHLYTAPTKPGTYKVQVFTENSLTNCVGNIGSAYQDYVIKKAKIEYQFPEGVTLSKDYDRTSVAAKAEEFIINHLGWDDKSGKYDGEARDNGDRLVYNAAYYDETGKKLTEVPTEVGKYYLKVVTNTNDYYEAADAQLPFEISQAENKWTTPLTIDGWTYGATPNKPTATAKFGTDPENTIEYTYSRFSDFRTAVKEPDASGTWYVRAYIPETKNYTGLEDVRKFYISYNDPYNYYTISAKAGENGSITPSGDTVLKEEESQTYTITPSEGYEIADVLVDGVSVGKVESYTFDTVTASHSIEASFVKKSEETPTPTPTPEEPQIPENYPDGTKKDENGNYVTPNGTVIAEDGTITRADGTVFAPDADGNKPSIDKEENITDTNGNVYGTDGSIKDSEGNYTQPAKAMLEDAYAQKNYVKVKAYEAAGAEGYDYVLGTSADMLENGTYVRAKKNKTTSTYFQYAGKGTWYVACHAWKKDAEGNKVFGPWSEVREVEVTAVTPETPVIETTVKGSTVTISYNKCADTVRYNVVLGTETAYKRGETYPTSYGSYIKKVVGNKVVVTFKNVKAGTYYVAVRPWNNSGDDNARVYGKWSNMDTIEVE